MSAILQKWSKNASFGSAPPSHRHNGLPFDSNGRLAVHNGGVIDHYHLGLPYTANGRIAVDLNAVPVRSGSGSATYSTNGRLVVAAPG